MSGQTFNVVGQWAHHGQTTLKQRCIDVTDVDTTLFRCRLTMTCPLGGYGTLGDPWNKSVDERDYKIQNRR